MYSFLSFSIFCNMSKSHLNILSPLQQVQHVLSTTSCQALPSFITYKWSLLVFTNYMRLSSGFTSNTHTHTPWMLMYACMMFLHRMQVRDYCMGDNFQMTDYRTHEQLSCRNPADINLNILVTCAVLSLKWGFRYIQGLQSLENPSASTCL